MNHYPDTLNSNLGRNPLLEITGFVQNHKLCDRKQKGNCQKQNFDKQTQKAIKLGTSTVTREEKIKVKERYE